MLKGVEVVAVMMRANPYLGSKPSILAILITTALCCCLASPIAVAEVKNYQDDWTNSITVTGGRTILVEELSATWCSSCAEIDPYLQQVADAHGSRITIVTYHPSDGDDAFQPEAADHRIKRMRSINPEVGGTPSFVVESGTLRVGPNSWPDVQKDILKAETNRQEFSQLSFNVSRDGNEYMAMISDLSLLETNYSAQLTFMLMSHNLAVPDGFFNPGEAYRDRVVVATASCSLSNYTIDNIGFKSAYSTNCSEDFSVNFSHSGQFSIILLHEATDSSVATNPNLATTLGLVEFGYRDVEIVNETNIMPHIFFTMLTLGAIWVAFDKITAKKSRNSD